MELFEKLKQFPPVLYLWKCRYDRKFRESHDNMFSGVYESFAEAIRHIPDTKPIGYDNPEPARMYREVMTSIRSYDYPVLYWLNDIKGHVSSILDYGGHVGILYYGINRLMPLPDGLTWTVFDVPAVVAEGRRIGQEKNVSQLQFTDDLSSIQHVDLFIASGSPQYVETPLIDIVTGLTALPKHIILNMIPLHPIRQFITINSMDVVYCPYKIAHLDSFLTDFMDCGYELRDQWINDNKRCHIPFEREAMGIAYYGMYFTLKS